MNPFRRRRRSPALLAAAGAGAAAGLMGAGWLLYVRRREKRTRRMHRVLVDLLLNALSADDPVTARHSRRVADLAFAMGRCAKLPRDRLATLRIGALLHDMGKIDDRFFDIVHSREPLSDDERAKIERHPHESAHILAPLEPFHPGLRDIVSSHHEAWNGTGYPRGLAGEEIPLEARIVTLADVFDAMAQPRAYRDAVPVEDVREKLREGAGSEFDPELVQLAMTPPLRERWDEIAEAGLRDERRWLRPAGPRSHDERAGPA